MKQILAGLIVALFALTAFSSSGVANAAGHSSVYTMDNASSNSVLQFSAPPNGVLTLSGTFSTHGSGTGTGLGSQGAVALTDNGRWLVTVNAGSNEMTVFQVDSDGSIAQVHVTGALPASTTGLAAA
jgi:6-phosphogluconolactonase (cycloisomerase 2 family)